MFGKAEKLKYTEDIIQKSMPGQDGAFTEIAKSVYIQRVGLPGHDNSIASFLMLVLSGSRKARLYKQLALFFSHGGS